MKTAFADDLEPAGFFVLRAPLLPVERLVEQSDDLEAPAAGDAELAGALVRDRARTLAALRAAALDPVVREAVFCASPTLDEALRGWLRDPANPSASGVPAILVRYLARMAARATPFGLFSSCGTGSVGPGPSTLTLEDASLVRHTRLDMHYLTGLVQSLEREPEIAEALVHHAGNGLHRIGDRIHHAEAELRGETKERAYRLVSLDASEALLAALACTRAGATLAAIARHVRESVPGVDLDEARAFVDELAASQVVVSELGLPVTGVEPIHHVIATLRARGVGARAATILESVRDALAALDREGLGQSDAAYRAIAAQLRELSAPVEASRLFQVDLVRSARASCLGAPIVSEVSRGIALLRRIAVPPPEDELSAFATAFRARYEAREVPLAEALDEEHGVGFGKSSHVPSPLVEGLPLPTSSIGGTTTWGARQAWLTRRLVELARAGVRVWQLGEDDLVALESDGPAASPDSSYVAATVASDSPGALAAGDFEIAISGIAAGAANMLGRFCHADEELRLHVEALTAREQQLAPGAILAEIVHQPEGRVGNILCRPVLRAWEIPYLARPGVDTEHQIAIDDLMVSVERGDVRLRSRRLGLRVEPRMSNAHNPRTTSLGVYRFLCALRGGRRASQPVWDWGPLHDAPHLPRVASGRVILALEQWTLAARDLSPLRVQGEVERFRALRALRDRVGLPRWVSLVDGDNVLPVDLDNVLAVESFLGLVKQRASIVLTEVFPELQRAPVAGRAGRHVAEIVLPFVAIRSGEREAGAAASPSDAFTGAASAGGPATQRTFTPGSEWLYLKVYGGPATADTTLRDVVAPAVARFRETGAIERWFFIRYSDPLPHLRIRFRGAPRRLASEVLPALHHAMGEPLRAGRVHRFEVATYEREIERYGGDRGIELAEAYFEIDSDLALDVVRDFDGTADAEVRWRVTLLGMDRMLDDLGFPPREKLDLLGVIRGAFASEHAVDTRLERELGARFRAVRGEIEALLATRPHEAALPPELGGVRRALPLLARRTERAAAIVAKLRDEARAGALTVGFSDLAASLMHMHANRILAADHRVHELVLHDFLHRIHTSRAARARRAT